MYIPASCLVLAFLHLFIQDSYSERVKKASKATLQRVQKLLNEDAARQYSEIQNDGIDFFADVKRDPKAAQHRDELSVNNLEDYFQGDVDLSEQQVKIIEQELNPRKRAKRKVGRAPLYKQWDRTRPISFDFAETIPSVTKAKIRDAMRLWQRHTCVRFEENGPNVDRLEFFDGGGCSSFVGRVGGTQGISIATPGCDVVGIISHEIGHSLGIFHEQARPDQDRHIAINYNNIPISRWNNFQSVGKSQAETFDLPYDTGSVMHYGPYGFASDPYVPSIRTLEKTQQSTIGQRTGPSFLDFQAINAAYGCYAHCPQLPCLRNGYPHPNNCSTCICPDGLTGRYCEQIRPSNSDCGGVIYADQERRTITSPNYPRYFSRNSECFWLIIAPPEGRVFLQFDDEFDFFCEDTCDKSYVEVKYHDDKRLTGSRFCCSSAPKHQFVSFNNEMVVLMRGFGGASKGFKATFWSNHGEARKLPTPESTTAMTSEEEYEEETDQTTEETTKLPSFFTLPSFVTTFLTTTTQATTTFSSTTSSTTTPTTTVTTTISTTTQTIPETTTTPLRPKPTIPPSPPVFTFPPPIIPVTLPIDNLMSKLSGNLMLTTISPDIINSAAECGCGDWSDWKGECNQECGGCGHRLRTRTCQKTGCRESEKRPCNFKSCPSGTNFLINSGEFHILWRGCCVGLFRSGDECSALETNQNPFFKIISSLLSIQDAKNNKTGIPGKVPRGEH